MGKIIAITNQKGGVGKTTTAVNLAAAMGIQGKKTLVVDIDPQGNTSSGLGVDRRTLKKSMYDVMICAAKAEEVLLEMIDFDHRESILKRSLAPLLEEFDYIFIDCPPSLGLITTNALCAADSLLVPIQCEYYALEGLSQLMNTVRRVKRQYNETLDLEGVLLTMYDGRLNLTQQVVEEVKKYFQKKVYTTVIPRTVRLSEAPSFGKPIQYYDKNAKGAVAYNALAEEVLKQNA